MPRLTYFVPGDHNSCCDVCGRGFKFSDLSKRWDGAWACYACWEPRQPQDFVRGVKDDQSVPVGRPRVGVPTGLTTLFVNYLNSPLIFTNSSGDAITWTES